MKIFKKLLTSHLCHTIYYIIDRYLFYDCTTMMVNTIELILDLFHVHEDINKSEKDCRKLLVHESFNQPIHIVVTWS